MTGQHKPLWKPAPNTSPVMMSPMSHQGMKRTYDNNIAWPTDVISHGGH